MRFFNDFLFVFFILLKVAVFLALIALPIFLINKFCNGWWGLLYFVTIPFGFAVMEIGD